MKKYILVLLMLASPLMAQDNTEKQEEIMYKKSLVPLFLLGSYQFNMIDNSGLTLSSSFNINFEIHGNISVKPHLYSAFVYGRIGGVFSINETPPLLQAGFGISGYIYDNRHEQTFLGWSMMMGAGGLVNIDFENRSNNIGYDIFLRGQYNFHKYVGFVIGLSFEHFYAIGDQWDKDYAYLDNDINIFNIGITLGLAF